MGDAPATLADLVAPLTEAEFITLLRHRHLAYRPDSKAAAYAPLIGWHALRARLEAGDHPKRRDDIRVTKDSEAITPDRWMTKGKVDVAKLDQFLRDGFSVVVVNIEAHVPALAGVCAEIQQQYHEGAFAGVIVTSGTGAGAFKTHYDPEDLIILQVEGTKRWQVFRSPVANPLRGIAKQSPPPEDDPIFDEVLEPGDLLFLPAGHWHRCESGLSTSVHLGIFWLPPTPWHAVNRITNQLLADETFRTPLTRVEGAADFAAMEAEVKRRMIEKIGELKLDEFAAEWNKAAS